MHAYARVYCRYSFIKKLLFNVLPKSGWTGVLVAARYGFADVVRELITKFGCDRNAMIEVSKPDMYVLNFIVYLIYIYVAVHVT